jgi:hypothetical protein
MAEWSDEEVKELKILLREGAVLAEAARLLGKSVSDVNKKLRELGAQHAGRSESDPKE